MAHTPVAKGCSMPAARDRREDERRASLHKPRLAMRDLNQLGRGTVIGRTWQLVIGFDRC